MTSEKTSLRIVYMGTPDFAVPPLKALINSHHKVVGVVTVADKPAGRGRKLQQSAVKVCAMEAGLPVLQPEKLKSPEFLEALTALEADLFVVVAFRMLPKEVWNMPALGTFNLHGSLLPKYRGAAPINWAVIQGERETGLTTFLLDEEIDTGKILLQRRMTIEEKWTAGELHDALMPLGAELVVETVDLIASGKYSALPQEDTQATHAPKLTKENCQLDFSKTPQALVQQIRGLSPFPGAYYGDFKFLDAEILDDLEYTDRPELFVKGSELHLIYPLGSVKITQIKPAGKRAMTGRDFSNGTKTERIPLV